jgi:hypothetical protein
MDPLKRPMIRPYILRPIPALTATVLALITIRVGGADASLNIGSRRELFVDDALVEKLTGKAELRLHHPVPQEIAIIHDAPWEGSGCGTASSRTAVSTACITKRTNSR